MKISIPNLLGTLAAVQTGTMRGKLQGAQERDALEFQQFQQAVQADAQRRQAEADAREQQARTFQTALQIPGLTRESQQELTAQLLGLLQRPRPPADYGALTRGFNPQNRLLAPYRNLPTPAASPPLPLPALKYEPPHQEDAIQALVPALDALETNALDIEDDDTVDQVRGLRTQLLQRQLTPEQLRTQLRTLEAQGKVQRGLFTEFDSARQRLQGWHDSGRIKPEFLARAKRVLAAMQSLGAVNTPEKRRLWQELKEEELAPLEGSDYLQPSPEEELNAELARRRAEGTREARNERYLRAISRARSPAERLRRIDQQRAFAARYPGQVEPYGGAGYDATPRRRRLRLDAPPGTQPEAFLTGPNVPSFSEYEVPETPAEIRLRRLVAATEELEEPRAQAMARRGLYRQFQRFLRFLRSPAFASLPEAQQQAWAEQAHSLGESIGAAEWPELPPGVSPRVKTQWAAWGKDRELRRFLGDRNLGFAETPAAFRQELAPVKRGLERMHVLVSQGGTNSPLLPRILAAGQQVSRLEQQIDRLNREAQRSEDPEVRAQAAAAAAGLIPSLEALRREYQQIAGQVERLPRATGQKVPFSRAETGAIKILQGTVNPATGRNYTYPEAFNRVLGKRGN